MGNGQRRRTAEAMSDQDLRRTVPLAHEVRCCYQVFEVGGEVRVGEISLTLSQACEIEAQHTDTTTRQRLTDPASALEIRRAREAVGKQGICPGLVDAAVEAGGKLDAVGARKSQQLVPGTQVRRSRCFMLCPRRPRGVPVPIEV